MRSRLAGLAALALAAGLLQSASWGEEGFGQVTRSYHVPTRHGTLYVEVVHPTRDGRIARAPGVLTYSPYSVLGRVGDAGRWVPRGYARVWADVVGTGNSGGCYDYGGNREKQTG